MVQVRLTIGIRPVGAGSVPRWGGHHRGTEPAPTGEVQARDGARSYRRPSSRDRARSHRSEHLAAATKAWKVGLHAGTPHRRACDRLWEAAPSGDRLAARIM